MPIRLTTPYNPGDLDPGKRYTHVDIPSFKLLRDAAAIEIEVRHGYDDGAGFVPGLKPAVVVAVRDNPRAGTTDYTELVTALPRVPTLSIYENAGIQLYTYLIAKGHYPGEIE